MKYLGALILTVFLLGEILGWFAPVDPADSPGLMRNMQAEHIFLGGGIHRGK